MGAWHSEERRVDDRAQAGGLESLYAPIQDTRLGKHDIHANHASQAGILSVTPKQLTHADVLSVSDGRGGRLAETNLCGRFRSI